MTTIKTLDSTPKSVPFAKLQPGKLYQFFYGSRCDYSSVVTGIAGKTIDGHITFVALHVKQGKGCTCKDKPGAIWMGAGYEMHDKSFYLANDIEVAIRNNA